MSDLIRRYDALKAVDMWESVWTSTDSAIRALPAVTVQAQIDAAREAALREAALAVKECLIDESLPLTSHGVELNAVVYECHSAILALIRKGDQP